MHRPNRSKLAVFLSFLLILLSAACKEKPQLTKPRADPPTIVDVMIAGPQTITNRIEASGTVVASEYVELHPETSGRLTYLNVPEGNFVTKGTIIARVNDADLQAQMAKTRVQLELAQKTEGRYKQLLAANGLNQSDYDNVLNAVNGYKADLDYTQALIDKTIIRAPFSGVVGLRQVSLGAYVSPTIAIATIQQLDKIKIDFTLPEENGRLLKKGGVVDVILDQTGQLKRKATIIAVEPQVNQSTRNLVVRAILQEGKGNPGAFVTVTIPAGTDKNAILVPTNCIIPDDKNKQLVLVKDGKASFVNVETGLREASFVAITKGVSAGDTVVVTGVLFAKPKNPLKIRSIKTLDQLRQQ